MGICYMAQETQTGALYQPRGVGWGGRWDGVSKGGRDICILMADSYIPMAVEIWQKTTKFCKAIILQLKNKFKKKSSGRIDIDFLRTEVETNEIKSLMYIK